jgi:hypothetical protein
MLVSCLWRPYTLVCLPRTATVLLPDEIIFVDQGMTYMLDGQLPAEFSHWSELFDIVITSCRKPSFFLYEIQNLLYHL